MTNSNSTSTSRMQQSSLCLPPELFAAVFSFHVIFNRNQEIIQVGDILQQVCPELSLGDRIEQHFRIERPEILFNFDYICQHSQSLFLLEVLCNSMKLKGQMVYVEQMEAIIFLGSPWITDIANLKTCGLNFNQFYAASSGNLLSRAGSEREFSGPEKTTHDISQQAIAPNDLHRLESTRPLQDPAVEFLLLLQAQNTALTDAEKLTQELTQQRGELRKINQRLNALYAVTHILVESATFSEAIIKALESICTTFGWHLGTLWSVEPQTHLLRCQNIWTSRPDEFAEFESMTHTLTFALGVDLPGSIWQRSEHIWIENISTNSSFARFSNTLVGLHSYFGLPIKRGSEVIGVLEFFSEQIEEPDENLLEMMFDIALKISQLQERKQTEAALQKQTEISESLRSILDSMGDAVIVTDEDKNLLVFNPAAERMFGSRVENLLNNQSSQQLLFCLADGITPLSTEKLPLDRSIRGEEVDDLEIFVQQAKENNGLWMMVTGRPLKDKNGVLKGGMIVCRDITESKRVEHQLLHDALHDGLTGLANRALFMDRLERAIALAKRQESYLFALLFLDLDRFKVINDSLGHAVGDQLLIAISRRLEACLRSGDTIARLGGDEFAILLEDIRDTEYATQVAERVQKDLIVPFNIRGHEIFAGTSIGIALSTIGYETPQDLLRDADTAMYNAKAQGKSRYQIFNTTMHARAVALLQIETDLRRALERNEFRLHYQPIVSLQNLKISGFEALVRWYHPERGLISPGDFIPVAEDTGLIIPLGLWVLQEACSQLRAWQLEFPSAEALTVSVNISGRQFSQSNLVEQVQKILQETELDPRRLKLEITESKFMENVDSTVAMLSKLQALGIQVSMDDFGTGYSSLSYLNRFPINTLKIDRSFVNSVDTDIEKMEIIRTVVTLAWNLGMDVVAEGVETAEQFSQLKALRCESGQGYFFSKPVDSATATNLIATELAGNKKKKRTR